LHNRISGRLRRAGRYATLDGVRTPLDPGSLLVGRLYVDLHRVVAAACPVA